MIAFASSIDSNRFAFEHSSRSEPFNDSTKALAVGLPGRLKSTCPPLIVRPQIEHEA